MKKDALCFDEPVLSAVEGLSMSGEMHAAQGFPLTLNVSKGERKAFFDGLLSGRAQGGTIEPGAPLG